MDDTVDLCMLLESAEKSLFAKGRPHSRNQMDNSAAVEKKAVGKSSQWFTDRVDTRRR